jgi:transcription elongation factor Elf1
MYFIHYNAEKVPVEVIAVVTVDGVDSDDKTKAAVPGVSLPTRWVRLAPAAEIALPSTSKTEPSNNKPPIRWSARRLLGVVGLALTAFIGFTLYSVMGTPNTPPTASEPQRYLYCPQCGLEMTYQPDQEGRAVFCPHCGKDRPMEVNTFSHSLGEEPPLSSTAKILLALAMGVPVALAVITYQSGRQRTPEVAANVFACPACGHKLRSHILGPGSTAVCPTCAEHFLVRAARGTNNRHSTEALK